MREKYDKQSRNKQKRILDWFLTLEGNWNWNLGFDQFGSIEFPSFDEVNYLNLFEYIDFEGLGPLSLLFES